MEADGGAAHSKQESRSWSGGWADGFGGVAGRKGGRSWSPGKEERFCWGERGRNDDYFRRGGGRLVVGLATCGGAGGGSNNGEREGERNCRNGGRGAGF